MAEQFCSPAWLLARADETAHPTTHGRHSRTAPPPSWSLSAPARRRAPAPCAGLVEGEKVLSLWDEVLSVVVPDMGTVTVQGVQESDGEGKASDIRSLTSSV